MNALEKKALAGGIWFQLFTALLLFIPAGTLRFWEAWVYWTVFSACMLFTSLYFLKHDPAFVESRIKAGPTAEKEKSQKIIQGVLSVFLIALYIVPGLERRFRGLVVPTAAAWIGDALVVISFATIFAVFKQNRHASSIVEVKQDQPVISTGAYGVVRHPMYVGGVLLFLATALALRSLWAFIPAIGLCAGIVVRLLDEERFLSANLPGYTEYTNKVRFRLIPYVW